jgi:hypothetical protein
LKAGRDIQAQLDEETDEQNSQLLPEEEGSAHPGTEE